MRNFFSIAFLLDLILVIASLSASRYFLLNTQLAFIASLLIVMSSFYGYKRVVEQKAGLGGRDIVDEIEDRFDLYSEDPSNEGKSAKEIFEEEKAKIKKMGLRNFFKTSSGFFSPLRLLGYAFLTIVVMVLVRKGMFEVGAFLIGLAIVPLSAALAALIEGVKR